MKLDIKHWQLLLAIQQYQTLNQAAQSLGVTQSALSHRLAEAERRLGSPIFERDGRLLRPTPAGKILSQAAEHYLPELDRAEITFEQTATSKQYLVKVGVAHYSCYHWVPGYLQSLPGNRHQLQIDFVPAAIQNPLDSLRSGVADLLLYPGTYQDNSLENQHLFNDELVLVTNTDNRLSQLSKVNPEDLQDETYLTYSMTATPGFEFERYFKPAEVFPQRVQVVEMTDAIVELVIARQGVSIMSRWALTRVLEQQLLSAVALTESGLSLPWTVLTRISDRQHKGIQLTKKALIRYFGDK